MLTVSECAEARGFVKFDCALPQDWVNILRDEADAEARGNFVWSYDTDKIFGRPEPVTAEGDLTKALHPRCF